MGRGITLVVPDNCQQAFFTALVEPHLRSDRDAITGWKGCKLSAGKPASPITRVPKQGLALLLVKHPGERLLEFIRAPFDQAKAAAGYQIGAGRNRQLELGLEMLLIAIAAEGDTHRRKGRVLDIDPGIDPSAITEKRWTSSDPAEALAREAVKP